MTSFPTTTDTIGINPYLAKYTPDSNRSHFNGTTAELLARVHAGIGAGLMTPGWAEGVVKVAIHPEGVFCPMVRLQPGDVVRAVFDTRMEGDTPMLGGFTATGEKAPAGSAFVALYANPTLRADYAHACKVAREKGDPEPKASDYWAGDFAWEAACLQGNIGKGEDPQMPASLARNILGLPGGTPVDLERKWVEPGAWGNGQPGLPHYEPMAKYAARMRRLVEELARSVYFAYTHAQVEPPK